MPILNLPTFTFECVIREGRGILGMWKEFAIEEGRVLREGDPSIAGFLAEVVKPGGRSLMGISWVEQSIA
jgi:hypothetical protein